jgi:hypothetical protein
VAGVQLTSGAPYLVERASIYFQAHYGGVTVQSPGILKGVAWAPSLAFAINAYHTICGEASEDKVYPEVLRLRTADILAVHEPISVYAITTDEVFLRPTEQDDVKELVKHGYGLLTVSADGTVQRRLVAQPLVQHISSQDFRASLNGLPKSLRQQASAVFDTYAVTPTSGVAQLSEIVEGMVTRAYKDAIKKGWVPNPVPNTTAATLDALMVCPQLVAARAPLGGARAFYSDFRNLTHHFPKNKSKAHKKYCDCRHGFLEGLRRISALRASLKNIGLSGLT